MLKDHTVSKNKQLEAELERLIVNGPFRVFDRFLSIARLKEEYHVSQATVVQALEHLESKGVIFRKSRSGTFISPTSRTREILIVSGRTRADSSELNLFSYGLGESPYASRAGYVTINCTVNEFEQNLPNLRIIYKKLHAVIFFRCPEAILRHHRNLAEMNVFHMFYGSDSSGSMLGECCRYCYNEKELVSKALNILYDAGHRKIACFSCQGRTFEERTNCYINWMKEKKLMAREDLIFLLNEDDGYEFMLKRLSSGHPDCTAFFCSSNLLAGSLLLALKEKRIRVPDEIAILGVGNIQIAHMLRPTLGFVDIDYEKDTEVLIDFLSTLAANKFICSTPVIGESPLISMKGGSL